MSGGGGKGDDDQKVPTIDPIALIDAQTKANRVGVNTPFGSQAYSTDANGNAVLNTSLTPEMQALLSQQIASASGPASHFSLPGQNATILNGLNTRLDQRYGMGLPPAPPGGSTPGSGGGTGPVTPPITPPVTPPITPGSGGPGPSPGNNELFPGTTPKDWQGERGRFSMGPETVYIHDLLGPTAIQQGNLGPGPWASQGAYGAGQGSAMSGSSGGSFTPGMTQGNNFGIPLPGSGSGNYSDPSTGLPGQTAGGYLGSGSYSGMGQGLSAAGSGTSPFGLPTGSADLSGPATNGAGYINAPTSSPESTGKVMKLVKALLNSKIVKTAAPILGTLYGGPLVGAGVKYGMNQLNTGPSPQSAPPPASAPTFYNY